MRPYRPLGALALALAAAVLAVLALPVLLTGLAERQAWVAAMLAALVLTVGFVHRAARNLEVIGDSHPRFTPGQSVGWLFVPVLNLFMAHQVLTSLWRDSQPRPGTVRRRGADFSVAWVNVWLGLVLARLLLRILASPVASWLLATSYTALWIGQGAAFLFVVFGIVGRQEEQWLDLQQRRAVPKPSADALR